MKTKTQHTPGPWINCNNHVDDSNGVPLVRSCRDFERLNPADFRLIAAAPELLAALRGALNVMENASFDFQPHESIRLAGIEDARAAIAKAEGE